ncbi:Protein quaking-A, partial [Larimichthys crocea]
YNFVGRILGPRGLTAKQLEAETGCKIMVRGKSSMRDKKKEEQNRGKPNWEHLNEDLHVLITVEDSQARAEIKMRRAVEEKEHTVDAVFVKARQMDLNGRQVWRSAGCCVCTRQYASGLADRYNGSAIRSTQTGKAQAQREDDAERAELDFNPWKLTAVDNCGTKREKHSNMQMHHRCHVQSRGACSRKLNKQVNYVQFITCADVLNLATSAHSSLFSNRPLSGECGIVDKSSWQRGESNHFPPDVSLGRNQKGGACCVYLRVRWIGEGRGAGVSQGERGCIPISTLKQPLVYTVFHMHAEGEDNLKKMQLMELAILNGTYRDNNIKTPAAAAAQGPRLIAAPTGQVLPPPALRPPTPAGAPIMNLIRPSQMAAMLPNGTPTLVPPTPDGGLIYTTPYEYPYTLAPTSLLEYPIEHSGVLGAMATKVRRHDTRVHPYQRIVTADRAATGN